MSSGFETRLLIVWVTLSAITLVSVWIGSVDARQALRPSTLVAASGILIALLKTRLVFREFMEVRHAPVLLRRLTDGWLILTAVTLLGIYFVGTALSSG